MQKLPFDLKVGDYCFAYRKGIHKVVSIEFPTRQASTALVNLISVLDSKLNKTSATKHSCDVAWCKKIDVSKYLEEVKASHISQLNSIKEYLV